MDEAAAAAAAAAAIGRASLRRSHHPFSSFLAGRRQPCVRYRERGRESPEKEAMGEM